MKKSEIIDAVMKEAKGNGKGKCPPEGCIKKKPNGEWGIISDKTGEFWPQDYPSREHAVKALEAYQVNKNK